MTGPPDWMADGICRDADADMFFPEKGQGVDAARALCVRCPVVDVCREWAVTRSVEFGVWGGTTGRERRRMAHARGLVWRSWSSWSDGIERSSQVAAVRKRAERARAGGVAA